MEGPSLFLAAEQLVPFINQTIKQVEGNTKIGKERLLNHKVLDIFAWGKHLVFQFENFALRVHFMMFGSFEALIKNKKVTGDYPTKNRAPRLRLVFPNGEIDLYSCSLKYVESAHAKNEYDYSINIMTPSWDSKKALNNVKKEADNEIADVLLDQTIFAGVGNIIKNEVLFLVKILPTHLVRELSLAQLKKTIKTAQEFSLQFYEWRKIFELKKHYQVYRRSTCPICGGKVTRQRTGMRERISFFCLNCQK